ncbi:MAG: urease accessory protein UreD [Pelistega sp.]|nr:urease accessory protein UreD [Pelistega sp.]
MSTWLAELDLTFSQQTTGTTRLSGKRHRGPLLVQRALYPEGPGICHAMILHPPAGIAAGDHLRIHTHLQEHSHAVLSTPGATRWYKAPDQSAKQSLRLQVDAYAKLDWLPYENIFFEQANAINQTQVHLHKESSAIAWDMAQLGAIQQEQHWQEGRINLQTELFIDEQLMWLEQGQLEAKSWQRQAVSAWANYPVMANIWAYGERISHEVFQQLCDTAPWQENLRGGFTHMHVAPGKSLILGRFLGLHCEHVRQHLIQAWRRLRPLIHHTEYQALRIWNT